MLICFTAMAGIFGIEWRLGGIRVDVFQPELAPPSCGLHPLALTAVIEGILSRSMQLSGSCVRLTVHSLSC